MNSILQIKPGIDTQPQNKQNHNCLCISEINTSIFAIRYKCFFVTPDSKSGSATFSLAVKSSNKLFD